MSFPERKSIFREGGKDHAEAANLFLLRETFSVRMFSSVLFSFEISYCGYRLISLVGWFYRLFFFSAVAICRYLQILHNINLDYKKNLSNFGGKKNQTIFLHFITLAIKKY